MSPLALLALATSALLVGPLVASVGAGSQAAHTFVDRASRILVGGLCGALVLPHVVHALGALGVGLAAAGLALPWLFHRWAAGRAVSTGIAAVALIAHVLVDGAVLGLEEESPLAWAVVAHRLPIGFALVVAASRSKRSQRAALRTAWLVVLGVGAATGVGFIVGPEIVGWISGPAPLVLEALVAGWLLHVVFTPHRPA
jgi:hypothetical protein